MTRAESPLLDNRAEYAGQSSARLQSIDQDSAPEMFRAFSHRFDPEALTRIATLAPLIGASENKCSLRRLDSVQPPAPIRPLAAALPLCRICSQPRFLYLGYARSRDTPCRGSQLRHHAVCPAACVWISLRGGLGAPGRLTQLSY